MQVKDVMNPDVKMIDPDSSVQEAAELMSKHSIGSLIVTKDTRLVGIVTERDILMKVVAQAKDASKTKVKDIMTKDVIVIRPDADIDEAVQAMLENKIKKLPVVYKNRLIGIVTSMDLCTASPRLVEQLAALLLLPRKKKVIAG